jgi:tetratricopeptide (TPR) repeat protein
MLLMLLGGAWQAAAQHEHGSDPLAMPAAKSPLAGGGNYHFPITTRNPEAQKFFNQGIAQLYGFNHDEAFRLFKRAAELDPAAVMPVWGMALTLGSHINNGPDAARESAAYKTISKARALTAGAPEHERAYVEALAARYSSDLKADTAQLARDYSEAMGILHARYPDDPDAATLYAEALMNLNPWKYWDREGKPLGETARFVAVLEGVLRRWPEHPGANHYYIHAVEASKQPERALPSAQRLGSLVPGAGHLVHMPGHIFARTGDWELAARANEAAVRADRAYLKGRPQEGLYPLMYHPHNIHFLAYARASQGRCQAAAKATSELRQQVLPGLDAMAMIQAFLTYDWLVPLWCPSLPLPEAKPAEKYPLLRAMHHYAAGVRAAWAGQASAARRELDAFRRVAPQVPPDMIYEVDYTAAYLRVAEKSLEAWIATASSDAAGAVRLWREALAAYDELRYDEPPLWYYNVRQSLGAALLRAGEYSEAEKTLREGLAANPRDGRMLFLLWKSMAAQGKTRAAALAESDYRAAWAGADLTLDAGKL